MAYYKLTLKEVTPVCEDVILLSFLPAKGEDIKYVAGQYLNISLPEKNQHIHPRSYSIASIPEDPCISFAIRIRGEMSQMLHNLKIGESIVAEGPHGTFIVPQGFSSIICAAAGIGIVPFYAWIRSLVASHNPQKISVTCLVSNTTELRAPFLQELLEIATEEPWLTIVPFFTKQDNCALENSVFSRISAKELKKAATEVDKTAIAFCGSSEFTYDMWKSAKEIGFNEKNIFTEAFF